MDDASLFNTLNQIKTTMQQGEIWNGRLAMLGVVAAIGSYVMTGQLIPGIY